MKTYSQIKTEQQENNKTMQLFENLHNNGISYKNVHFYKSPNITSNYSMGEMIIVKCGENHIENVDRTKNYSKYCKWKAKHGKIVVCFSKKGLREYVDICKKIDTTKDRNVIIEGFKQQRALLEKYIDKNESEYKRAYIIYN
jgi:hypothetical protein